MSPSSTLRRYLKRTWPDPLHGSEHWSRSKKKRKLGKIAATLQHYGPRILPVTLMDLVPVDEKHPWSKQRRFRLCLYGIRECLQSGDVICSSDNRKGIVLYFIQQEHVTCIVLACVKQRNELVFHWQPFISESQGSELIPTDQEYTIHLGHVETIIPKDQVKLSSFKLQQDVLRYDFSKTLSSSVRLMVDSYLTCKTNFLSRHPLVIQLAGFVSLWLTSAKLAEYILANFQAYRSGILEDEEYIDFDVPVLASYAMNLSYDKCTLCGLYRSMVFSEQKCRACEPCYVKLRKVYRIFATLEPLRGQHVNTNQEELLDEVYIHVENLQLF